VITWQPLYALSRDNLGENGYGNLGADGYRRCSRGISSRLSRFIALAFADL
jgi:hypothetical protein